MSKRKVPPHQDSQLTNGLPRNSSIASSYGSTSSLQHSPNQFRYHTDELPATPTANGGPYRSHSGESNDGARGIGGASLSQRKNSNSSSIFSSKLGRRNKPTPPVPVDSSGSPALSFSQTIHRPSFEDKSLIAPHIRAHETVGSDQHYRSSFDAPPSTASSSKYGPSTIRGSDAEYGARAVMENGWDGWGVKMPVSYGGNDSIGNKISARGGPGDMIAPWDYPDDAPPRGSSPSKKAPSFSASSERNGKSTKMSREGSVKKKGGLFSGNFSLLKRKNTENVDDSFAPMPNNAGYDKLTLPAKLQARGDATDHQYTPTPSIKGGKAFRRPKKTSIASPSSSSRPGPEPVRARSTLGSDPGISLDTDLESMEGIVNMAAYSPPSVTARNRSTSDNSSVEYDGYLDHRPSISDSLHRAGSTSQGLGIEAPNRRGSLAAQSFYHSEVHSRNSPYPVTDGHPPPLPTSTSQSFHDSVSQQASTSSFWSAAQQPSSSNHIHRDQPVSPHTTFPLPLARPYPIRQDSTYSHISNPDRRRSIIAIPPSVLTKEGAAWTAPDSWAVKGDAGFLEPDTSEEEDDDGEDSVDGEGELSGVPGDTPVIPGEKELARIGTAVAGGRVGTTLKNGRPSEGFIRVSQKNFMIRVFRPDSTFSTLPVPITVTASELTATMSRKYQVNAKSGHALYLREKGLERRMGPNERPVLLQKRRFEQAGYTELDKLEDLGREDNSYLCKLVYKANHASLSAPEDDMGGTMEYVDLSGRGVETIPIFLYRQAHEIVSLNLSKNRPFDLPTDFVQLCLVMRELVISHMGLKRIPQALKECIGLTRLDISNNNIVDLEHIALDELVELTSLKCHNNRLYSLPDYFTQFKNLKYLNLSNNRFDSVPAVVCEVVCLVELDVSFNTISVLPSEIGKLKHLERLVVLANTIAFLPASLGSLAYLKEFDCRRNMITDLSPISGIDRLEVLRCEYNFNSVLDANWAHMRILTASNNSLTRFALAGTGGTLTSLNLSFAKLSTLAPDMFEHLGGVENLVFDSNQIRVLPDGIGSLSNLVHFSIKNNILAELPATIGNLQRLQTLQISGNNIAFLPPQIWLCSSLITLNASSNLLKDFPDPPLGSANVENGAEEPEGRKPSALVKPGTSSGRIAPPLALCLQKIYLGDNQLGDDVFAPISLMTGIRILNLSFNEISEIPTLSLYKCQQLEELYLSGNRLTSLPPEDLERLGNLKLIYLNGNKLQTLPAELGKIKRLFALDVGNNVLKYNIANWPYDWNWNWNLELRYLNLSGNTRLEIKPGHQPEPPQAYAPGSRTQKRRNLADFSALTKLHILGLMDVTLMIPSVPDENEDRRVRTSLSEINDMGYGIADTLGSRCDTLSLVDIVVPRFRSKDDEAIFGLFDAVNKSTDSGSRIVRYLQYHFAAVFTLELSRLKSGEMTSDALRRTFLGINRDYGNSLLPTGDSKRKGSEVSMSDRNAMERCTGAAGIIVYIRKRKMYVANAGNALAVISSRGGSARLIAKKHDPFEAGEVARIRTAEGWISHRGFVNEEVDVSRAFGFFNVFPAINCSPNIEEIELSDSDEFVIIANRGLWEHMSYQAAVDVARTERKNPMNAASKLRDLAISYGSASNVMVMVLAIADIFKPKRDYRVPRGIAGPEPVDTFYKSGADIRRTKEGGAADRYLNLLDQEVQPPVGLVALVFTDIRNSTALWESNPGMQSAIRMHNQLLRRQLRAIGGYEVKTEGDAFMVSFPTVTSALLWCLTCQVELLRQDWPQEILDSEEGKEILNSRGEVIYRGLSVRMGIHWGAPVCEADPITRRMDYFGPMVNRASRISAVAEGGQISASQDVVDIIEDAVMERTTRPSSLDSDNGEDEEPENPASDGWDLDPSVLALRRLGFGISELGERKLKGMETPETLSLIWPKSLKERVAKADKAEVWVTPSTHEIDIAVINGLIRVVARLEAVASSLIHGNSTLRTPLSFLTPPAGPDASDEDRAVMVEACTSRIENCLASLVLKQLGPLTEVLAALGIALGSNPEYILLALNRYSAMMRQIGGDA